MKLIIFTDGGARGNPGPAGIGAVIYNEKKEIIAELKEYIGEATNNTAEYKALIMALIKAESLGGRDLEVNMDSELVVKQMQGLYKIKEPNLQVLAATVIKLKNNFRSVIFRHVRREFNKLADKLVNEVIDGAISAK